MKRSDRKRFIVIDEKSVEVILYDKAQRGLEITMARYRYKYQLAGPWLVVICIYNEKFGNTCVS